MFQNEIISEQNRTEYIYVNLSIYIQLIIVANKIDIHSMHK